MLALICLALLIGNLPIGPGERYAHAGMGNAADWYRVRTNGFPYRPQNVALDPSGGLWITAVEEYDPCLWYLPPDASVAEFQYFTNHPRNNGVDPSYLTLRAKPQLEAGVRYAVQDRQGDAWYALSNRKVVCEKTDGSWLTFTMQDTGQVINDSAHRIRLIDRQDGTQDKLLISCMGLVRVDAGFSVAESRRNYEPYYNNDFIHDALIDRQGRYWVATNTGVETGSSLVNTTYVSLLYPGNPAVPGVGTAGGLPITCIEEDAQGNLWFGSNSYSADGIYCYTAGGGWIKYTDGVVASIGKKVNAIAAAQDGSVWFGGALSQSGGLLKFSADPGGEQWTRYRGIDLGVESEDVPSLVWVDGGLWFVTGYNPSVSGNGTGLHFLTLEQDGQAQVAHYTYRNTSSTLTSHRFNAIAADRSGGVWFPAYDDPGIARLKADGSWEQFRGQAGGKSLGSSGIAGVAADSLNRIYFAPQNTPPVAYDVDTEQWMSLPDAPYTDFYYYGVYVDPDDGKWFHGAFGVYYLDEDNTQWTRYSTAEVAAFPDDYVEQVLVDDTRHVWFMCRYGIALMKKDPEGGEPLWRTFTSGDDSGYLGGYRVYPDDSGGVWNAAKQKYDVQNDKWLTVADTGEFDRRHLRFLNGRVPADMDLTGALPPVGILNQATMTVNTRGDVYFCGGIAGGVYSVNNGIVVCSPPMGDVDRDARVGLADAVSALKIVAGGSSEAFSAAGDVNGNGRIGLDEVIHVLQQAARNLVP